MIPYPNWPLISWQALLQLPTCLFRSPIRYISTPQVIWSRVSYRNRPGTPVFSWSGQSVCGAYLHWNGIGMASLTTMSLSLFLFTLIIRCLRFESNTTNYCNSISSVCNANNIIGNSQVRPASQYSSHLIHSRVHIWPSPLADNPLTLVAVFLFFILTSRRCEVKLYFYTQV